MLSLLDEYYAILLTNQNSSNISLENAENPTTGFFGYIGKKISGNIPKTSGLITWYWKKDLLRVRFLHVIGNDGKLQPLNPDISKQFFMKAKFILINKKLSYDIINGIEKYLKDFQIPATVKMFDNCPFCDLNGRITLMQTQEAFQSLKGLNICRECALNEIIRELQIRGVNVSSSVKNFVNRLLTQNNRLIDILHILDGKQEYGKDTVVKEISGSDLPVKPLELIPQLSKSMIANLQRRHIDTLLPAQYLAIEAGIIDKNPKDVLVVAETSAGKTLVGELAAIKTILEHKKQVLFLVPLVALANTKYESFRKTFADEGFSIGLKVGTERLVVVKKRKIIPDTQNLSSKEIVVGTYEGVDQILRSGWSLDNIGLIVIDEIQTLAEEDRGPTLDGLISRLRLQKHPPQIIGLSATIGNPEYLSEQLKLQLVRYTGRPIPLEVHILVIPYQDVKNSKIAEIILREREEYSSKGYKGQTMIFTNSRRKTKEIRDYLLNERIRTANYHSGLSYGIRKDVEEIFDAGKIDAVVATYALGAGVDFPASTVIFESMQMGKDLLLNRTNIFFQMQGRAGRLGKHDKGKVILLATPFPPNSSTQMSEIDIAMSLIKAKHEDVKPEYDLNITATQVLATMSYIQEASSEILKKSFKSLLGATGSFEGVINYLLRLNFIEKIKDQDNWYMITSLGRASALSFLTVEETELVLNLLNKKDPIDIAILLEPFESIQLSSQLIGYLEQVLQTHIPSRLFNNSALELLDEASIKVEKLDPKVTTILTTWAKEFFNCNCKDRPYCDDGMININRKLLELRTFGNSPDRIAKIFDRYYSLNIYSGDLLRWLETILYKLEGIEKIATAVRKDTILIRQIAKAIQKGETLEPEEEKVKSEEKILDATKQKRKESLITTVTGLDPIPPSILKALKTLRKKTHKNEITD